MKILIAPCSFKESLTALEAANAIACGFQSIGSNYQTVIHPLADGGEGTLSILMETLGGGVKRVQTKDPLGRPIEAHFGLIRSGTVAVVESAETIGLHLVEPEERHAGLTSSEGLGQVFKHLLDRQVREIWVGLGGSATVDGGSGFLNGLGARFLDRDQRPVPCNGYALSNIDRIDMSGLDPRLSQTRIVVLCDVDAPLLGPRGAAMYIRQKGASESEARQLTENLEHWAALTRDAFGRDVNQRPGSGAAGGLGGAMALIGGKLVSGSAFVLEQTGLVDKLEGADLVVTGEGRIDRQTTQGKAIRALAGLAKSKGKSVIALCGTRDIEDRFLDEMGVTAVFSITPGPISVEEAKRANAVLLRQTSAELARLIAALPN